MSFFVLLNVLFSCAVFSEPEIVEARDGYNRLFVMEKLTGGDDPRTKSWSKFAESTIALNQQFLEKTGFYVSARATDALQWASESIKKLPGFENWEPTQQYLESQLSSKDWYAKNRIFFDFDAVLENLGHWADYYRSVGGQDKEKARKIRHFHNGIYDGLDNFRKAVQRNQWDSMEKWVVYVSRDGLRLEDSFDWRKTKNIEMVMTVLVPKDGTPMTIHMGISRNFINLMHGEQTPQTATQLHGFAAKVIDSMRPGFTMVTTPSGPMTEILQKAGLSSEDISVGVGEGTRLKIVSDACRPDFEFTLLRKGTACNANFTRTAADKSFADCCQLLHVNVPYVAVDLSDLKTLFTSP